MPIIGYHAVYAILARFVFVVKFSRALFNKNVNPDLNQCSIDLAVHCWNSSLKDA